MEKTILWGNNTVYRKSKRYNLTVNDLKCTNVKQKSNLSNFATIMKIEMLLGQHSAFDWKQFQFQQLQIVSENYVYIPIG